jgi:hypothetical protein
MKIRRIVMRLSRMTVLLAVSISLFVLSACSDKSGGGSNTEPVSSLPPAASDEDFDPANFSHPTQVTNPWFPLVPGTRFTWTGHALDDGRQVSRKVVFTVTDLTKVVDGVRTIVVWDRDITDGTLEENELAFFAQDDDGNIWHFGQYPEEYDGKEIVKTPTWIAGLHGARPGVTMQAVPRLHTPSYAEGWGGSDVNWTDRGKVDQVGQQTCVPVDCYTDVLVVDEFNPDEPGAHQLKYYAPEVGGVRVGWRGAGEEEREVLVLVALEHLSATQMEEVRQTALAQEARAYRISPNVYGTTQPIDQA